MLDFSPFGHRTSFQSKAKNLYHLRLWDASLRSSMTGSRFGWTYIELRLILGHFLPLSARNDAFAKEIARKLADRYKDLTLAWQRRTITRRCLIILGLSISNKAVCSAWLRSGMTGACFPLCNGLNKPYTLNLTRLSCANKQHYT